VKAPLQTVCTMLQCTLHASAVIFCVLWTFVSLKCWLLKNSFEVLLDNVNSALNLTMQQCKHLTGKGVWIFPWPFSDSYCSPLFLALKSHFLHFTCSVDVSRGSPTTGSGSPALYKLQVLLAWCVAPNKSPFPGLHGGQDSLAMTGNLPKGRKA
jgi:hypothetical protein